jgi:hypothetical protein
VVEDLVAHALEVDGHRAAGAALGRMVEDHVQDHADAGAVQGLHEVAELVASLRRVDCEAG